MQKCFLYIFVIFLTGFLRVWELWESHCLKFPPYVFVPESLLFLFCVCLLSQTTNQCIKHWRGETKEVKARSPAPVSSAQVFERSICYLTDIDEIGFFQVHVEFDQHPQHVVTELLVLHQGHAHLQAVGKEATHIILEGKWKERNS